MAPTIQNINRRVEDDDDAPFIYRRRRFSQPQRSLRRSRPWVVAEEDDDVIPVDDAESDPQESEEKQDDEFEAEAAAEKEEADGEHDGGGGSAEAEPVSEERNRQQQQMICSTSASSSSSSLRGLQKIGALLRRRSTNDFPVLNKANGTVLLLADPDVLDCPICLDPLYSPVFQCENGHIACFSCCSKVQSKCPFCCMQIGTDNNNHCRGLEKFIESISRISCKYARNGCKKKIAYSKKCEHEQICPHATCDCPYLSCPFVGSLKNLYLHFGIHHAACATRFTYNTTLSISIGLDEKHVFLQEQHENVIFILNHQVQNHGRALSVDFVGGPGTLLKGSFVYQLNAKHMDTYLSMQSVPEIYRECSDDNPRRNNLTVPYEFAGYNGLLLLSVCIKKGISSEFEEEEEEVEEVFGNEDHDNANGALQVVLTDVDVLNCSICLESLWTPIFQCQKGHLACSSCCSQVKSTCLLCLSEVTYNRCRGLEKVIESIKIACINSEHGCKKIIPYNKKNEHEQMCPHATCYCPHPSCLFSSSSNNLYLHFGIQHAASITRFTYNTTFSLCLDVNQKHIFLQEQRQNVIFILNHEVKKHGRLVSVEFVGANTSRNYFDYQLTAKNMETSQSWQSVTEIYTKWSKHTPTKNHLTIPFEFADYNGCLSVSMCIKEGIEALKWRIFGDDDCKQFLKLGNRGK